MLQSILKRFPELTPEDITLRDDADGKGVYIDIWNSDKPKPAIDDVKAWAEEDAINIEPALTPEEEIEQLKTQLAETKAETEQLNLAMIDLWEMVLI